MYSSFENFSFVYNEILLSVFLLVSLSFGVYYSTSKNYGLLSLSAPNIFFTAFMTILVFFVSFDTIGLTYTSFNDVLVFDPYTCFFQGFILLVSSTILAISKNFLLTRGVFLYEYSAITLLSIIGLLFLCSSSNILMLFLVIELQSLAFYLLASFQWNSEYATEAGIKYFILGSFSSCLLLFGFSLLYLSSGSSSFEVIQNLATSPAFLDTTSIGILFCFTAFLFKVGASPFHMWLTDVYEGSLTSVTLFFAAVPKLILFYLLIKFSFVIFLDYQHLWSPLFLVTGLLSIGIGSIAAFAQKKLKRLLAFSAISHTGFILLALSSGSALAIKACSFYMIFYAFMTFSVFSIILLSINHASFLKYLVNWSYSSKRNFVLTMTFSLILFSLAGIPPLTGFYSKLLVFLSLISEQQIIAALIGALLSCVGCFYYIRLIKIFFFCSSDKGTWIYSNDRSLEICLVISTLFVTLFLLRPDSVLLNSVLLSSSFITS